MDGTDRDRYDSDMIVKMNLILATIRPHRRSRTPNLLVAVQS